MVVQRLIQILWLCATLGLVPAHAAVIDVGQAREWSLHLSEWAKAYQDVSGSMSARQVAALPDSPGGFTAIDQLSDAGGPSPLPWWVKVQLANTSDTSRLLHLIQNPGSTFHSADVYIQRTGQWQAAQLDQEAAAVDESAAARFHSTAIKLAPGENRTVLIRTTGVAPAQLAPYLYSDVSFKEYLARSAIWDGLLFGGLLALAWATWALALFTRSRGFLLLGLLSFFTLLVEALRRGYGNLYVLSDTLEWGYRSPLVLGNLTILLFILFVLEIARIEKVRLPLHKLFVGWAFYYSSLVLVSAFGDVYLVYSLAEILRPFFSLTLLLIAILFIKNNAPTRKLMLAVAVFSLARASLLALETGGMLPDYIADLSMGTLRMNPVVALAGFFINLTLLAGWIAHVGMQRKKAQYELSQLQREESQRLAKEVAYQTAALNQALEYAGEKNRQQTRIVSYISHDLRAPLATIAGYTRLMEQTADEQEKTLLSAITRSVDYQMALIDDIMGYATAELKPLSLQPHAVDLPGYLDEAAQHAVALSRQQNNRFIVHAPDRIPQRVYMDGRRLRQVLLNLLSNASKFTRGGVIRLDLRAAPCDGAWRLRFTVSDSGVGIDASVQAQVFKEFRQLDPNSAGMGLGLYIAQSILQTMGAQLALDSSADHGSAFSFEIEVKPLGDEAAVWAAPSLLPTEENKLETAAASGLETASPTHPQHFASVPPPHVRSELAIMAKNGQLTDIEGWLPAMLARHPEYRAYFHAIQDAVGRLDLDAVEHLALAHAGAPKA